MPIRMSMNILPTMLHRSSIVCMTFPLITFRHFDILCTSERPALSGRWRRCGGGGGSSSRPRPDIERSHSDQHDHLDRTHDGPIAYEFWRDDATQNIESTFRHLGFPHPIPPSPGRAGRVVRRASRESLFPCNRSILSASFLFAFRIFPRSGEFL